MYQVFIDILLTLLTWLLYILAGLLAWGLVLVLIKHLN